MTVASSESKSSDRAPLALLLLAWLAGPASAEWRLSAYLGGAVTRPTYLLIEQPGLRLRVSGVGYEGRSFRTPLYYAYRVGYFFGGRLGIEAEFIHQKVLAEPGRVVSFDYLVEGRSAAGSSRFENVVPRFSISHGLNLLLANIAYSRPIARRVLLAGRFGTGPTIPHPEIIFRHDVGEQYQLGRPAIQAAASAEFRLWRGLHWLAEYKFTRTRQRVDIPRRGTAETLIRSHHGVFGLGYHF